MDAGSFVRDEVGRGSADLEGLVHRRGDGLELDGEGARQRDTGHVEGERAADPARDAVGGRQEQRTAAGDPQDGGVAAEDEGDIAERDLEDAPRGVRRSPGRERGYPLDREVTGEGLAEHREGDPDALDAQIGSTGQVEGDRRAADEQARRDRDGRRVHRDGQGDELE